MSAVLQQLLEGMGLDGTESASWSVLGGGLSNRSYKVSLEGAVLVVKLRRTEADFALDLGAEAELARSVAAAGLGPEVVGFDAELGALVTRHMNGVAWTRPAARKPRNIARIAERLQALHGLVVPCRSFEPQRYASRYIETLSSAGRLRAPDLDLAAELLEAARRYELSYRPTVLCHNDLVAENILDDGALTLIDFEYAVCAQPIVDLASLAAMNDFGAAERRQLLEAYFETGGIRYHEAELDWVARMLTLLAYFWAHAAAEGSGDAKIVAAFTDRSKLEKSWQKK